MTVRPFYDPYDINDDNIDCGHIIVAWCPEDDYEHRYVDPCEYLRECLWERPAIDRCTMIPWINANQPWIPTAQAWRVLRVNNAGDCVEFVEPEIAFPFEDIRVKVSENDTTPWFLEEKIVSCSDQLRIDVLNEWWDEVLELCVDVPDTFTDLEDVPDTYTDCSTSWYWVDGWFVMFNTAWVSFECDWRALRWQYYAQANLDWSYDNPGESTNAPFEPLGWLIWQPSWDPSKYLKQYYGNPNMLDTTSEWVIEIVQDGMYRIWFSATAEVNYHVQALRFFVATTNGKQIVGDSKFAMSPNHPMPNLQWENQLRFDTYYGGNYVWLNAWDKLIMWMRPELAVRQATLNDFSHIPPSWSRVWTIRVFRSSLWSWTLDSWTEVPMPYSGVMFWVKYHSPHRFAMDIG